MKGQKVREGFRGEAEKQPPGRGKAELRAGGLKRAGRGMGRKEGGGQRRRELGMGGGAGKVGGAGSWRPRPQTGLDHLGLRSPKSWRLAAMPLALGSLPEALWTALRPSTILLGAVAFLFFADFLKKRRPKNYPPGPPRLPFIGNLFHLDLDKGHLSLQRVGTGEGAWPCPDPDLKTRAVPGTEGGRMEALTLKQKSRYTRL